MESSSATAPGRTGEDTGALRATQVGLLIASLGAILIVFNLFGLGVAGIFLALGGTALAAPGGVGHGWWYAVLVGAIVAGLSRLLADSNEVAGGWLAVLGSITVLIGSVLGYPSRSERA
jgi:hypothetical protein